MSNERRLAITIKGGVSLGAYEAGALWQTLQLIARNNADPNAPKWYVDVVTGASAGAMTAAMVGVALLTGPNLAPANPFYQAWVKDVSVSAMVPRNTDPGYNLFDATALDRIAAADVRLPLTIARPHPALKPSNPLVKLLFTLSRLQTDPTNVPTWAGSLSYKEYADFAQFDLALNSKNPSPIVTAYGVLASGDNAQPQGDDHLVNDLNTAWRALVNAAIAAGSFPIAFAPRSLRRWIGGGWIDVPYVDGGLYDNDPVGQAINVAHDVDWTDPTLNDADRRFLIVHTEAADASGITLSANNSSLISVPVQEAVGKLFSSFVLESQTSGLRGIGPINDRIDQRTQILQSFVTSLTGNQSATRYESVINALQKARTLSDGQISDFRGWLIPDLQDLGDNQVLYNEVIALTSSQQESWKDLALIYDLSTNLVDKVKVQPILISPPAGTGLSGDPLYGFAGFFDVVLRDRDYRQGMWDAYQAWEQVSAAQDEKGRPLNEFSMNNATAPTDPETTDEISSDTLKQYSGEVAKFRDRVRVLLDSLASEIEDGSGLTADVKVKALELILEGVGRAAIDAGLKDVD